MSITLMQVYKNDTHMREHIIAIMQESARLNYKRDRLKTRLNGYIHSVKFTMAELRELHYLIHPTDQKRKKK